MLEIKYLGHSCFWVKSSDGLQVLIDPYNPASGYTLPAVEPAIVLISHNHALHNCLESVGGQPAVMQGEGYRELNWFKLWGFPAYHDQAGGAQRGANTVFCWEMRAVRFCHLGDLGHLPGPDLLKQIGPVGVLFFPIGGGSVLDPEEADALLRLIPYKYALPMHYRTVYNPRPRYALETFIAGRKDIIIPEPKNRLELTRRDFAGAPQIAALEYLPESKGASNANK